MLAALEAINFEHPSPVQAGVIPEALAGHDVIAQARTGTGKTAAFAIPILEKGWGPVEPRHPKAVVLAPTRELAVQVHREFERLSAGRGIVCQQVYGGQSIRRELDAFKNGVHVIVATPGRMLDHLQRRTINFSQIEVAVLDEADRMLEIGFREDIEKILRKCPQQKQTLLLSATLPDPILRLAQRYMRDPVQLDFSSKEITVDTIEQHYFTVHPTRKLDLLWRLLLREQPKQAIIFCRTKRATAKLQRVLSRKARSIDCMHGDMQQRERNRVMGKFRAGDTRILVATDVVGRGIDVTTVSHIINFDVPSDSDDYVHRVGRTGRMGREGVAFTFVTTDEGEELTKIEIRIDKLLIRDEIEGFDPTLPVDSPDAVAKPRPTEPPPKPLHSRDRGPGRHRRRL